MQEIFVPFLLLCGFVNCADGDHPFGEGKYMYVLKCIARSLLLSSFGGCVQHEGERRVSFFHLGQESKDPNVLFFGFIQVEWNQLHSPSIR